MYHFNPRTVRLAILFTLGLWIGGMFAGCTATYTAHWPGKHNAIDHHDAGRTVYKGGYYEPAPR